MKIGVDIDEVLSDLLSEYISFINNSHKLSLAKKNFRTYYMWDNWHGTLEDRIKLFDRFYKSNYFKNIKPLKGAIKGVSDLKNKHELYAITSRPDYLKAHTRYWINQYFPKTFSGVYFCSHILNKKKAEVCKKIGIEIMIEDSLGYAIECSLYDIKVILLSYPWNQFKTNNTKIIRVNSWSEIINVLEGIKIK